MLSLKEKQILSKLVEDNGISSIVLALANISSENADSFSDMSLKERSKQSAAEAVLLLKTHSVLVKA